MTETLLQDPKYFIPRHLLEKYFGEDPRLLRAFELQAQVVAEHDEILQNTVAATGSLQDATVVTLSANDTLTNEFVLTPGDGTLLAITAASIQINVDTSVVRSTGGPVSLAAPAAVTLALPASGTLLSDGVQPNLFAGLVNAASDSAAASAGVPIMGIYHNAGALRVRLV